MILQRHPAEDMQGVFFVTNKDVLFLYKQGIGHYNDVVMKTMCRIIDVIINFVWR